MYNTAMGTLTAVEPQKKKKTRVNLYVDGRFYCGLELVTFARSRLKPGDEVDEDELLKLITESETGTAFEKAVALVSRRRRTKSEIRQHLKEKGYPAPVIASVLEKLIEYRYVDDAEFCRSYIRDYGQRLGVRSIKQALKKHGVPDSVIEDVLDESEVDEASAAKKTAEKFVRTHKNTDKIKLTRHLFSKGFSYDIIKEAVNEALQSDNDEEFFEE